MGLEREGIALLFAKANDGDPMTGELRVAISSEADVLLARQHVKGLAEEVGLSPVNIALVATAVSELAHNIFEYAKRGEIVFSVEVQKDRCCLMVVARDWGPGIPNIALAMQDGYSTSRSLGLGLPGVKRLMDDFEIISEVGKGTTIVARKWACKNEWSPG